MIRATAVRALVLTAAFVASLTPVTCLGENRNQLPARATKELPPALLSLLRQKKMPKNSPILVRIFKEEAELEVWKQDTTGRRDSQPGRHVPLLSNAIEFHRTVTRWLHRVNEPGDEPAAHALRNPL